MALKPGTKLGPYEVLAQLGAGGMGEVYKGRDTRLDRLVAIKILPAHLADLPELRERFEREAHALANLKHANICVLYDVGQQEVVSEPRPEGSGGSVFSQDEPSRTIHYLVMEYLEGETLSARLKKGPLPLEQVLQYATEISDALDTAHRDGFTHRDIKPGNIMLVPSTSLGAGPKTISKVLDFGLAKLKQEVVRATLPASEQPTVPGGLTQHGTLLGTLQYMSPEQIEGKVKEIDHRTDVFAFGALVYEMGTGKKAFPGETQASIIAKVLEVDPPPMSSQQPAGKMVPPALDRVVKRCLAKNREDRWQTMRDLCHELTWIKDGDTEGRSLTVAARTPRQWLGWAAAAVLLLTTAAVSIVHFREMPPEALEARLSISTPDDMDRTQVTVSPDGRWLTFLARGSSGVNQVWLRPLDSLQAHPVSGTERAGNIIWSPDSRFLAFVTAQGTLKKVEVSGGPPQTLAELPNAINGTWNEDGVILVGSQQGILRVPAAGGDPVPVTTLDASRQEIAHGYPWFLPDGNHFLYFARTEQPETRGIYLGSLDGETPRRILRDSSMGIYAPPGYVLFVREGTLMAQPFNVDRMELAGEAFPIAENVRLVPILGRAAFYASGKGVLIYGTERFAGGELLWVDRDRKPLAKLRDVDADIHLSLAPDEKRAAVDLPTDSARDLWLLDLTRGTTTRFTFGMPGIDVCGNARSPVWTPNGSHLIFDARAGERQGLFKKLSSGAGEAELLLDVPSSCPTDLSTDGRFLLYQRQDPKTRWDVWALPLFGERKPTALLQSEFDEGHAQLSPDGKWLAYTSNESGQPEVYVQPFPGPGGKWQISTEGGVTPRWQRNGRELFFSNPPDLFSVEIDTAPQFEAGVPRLLFEIRGNMRHFMAPGDDYALSADSNRILIVGAKEEELASPPPITVVLNWQKAVTSGK